MGRRSITKIFQRLSYLKMLIYDTQTALFRLRATPKQVLLYKFKEKRLSFKNLLDNLFFVALQELTPTKRLLNPKVGSPKSHHSNP